MLLGLYCMQKKKIKTNVKWNILTDLLEICKKVKLKIKLILLFVFFLS